MRAKEPSAFNREGGGAWGKGRRFKIPGNGEGFGPKQKKKKNVGCGPGGGGVRWYSGRGKEGT